MNINKKESKPLSRSCSFSVGAKHFGALVTLLSLLIPAISYAQTSISVISDLNFGTITSENGQCQLKSNATLTGSSGQTCFGAGSYAELLITGTPHASVITTVFEGAAVNGVTFIPEISGSTVKSLGRTGQKTLKIVGSLILNNASGGILDIPYTVSVNYE